jgi:hypothetical protein
MRPLAVVLILTLSACSRSRSESSPAASSGPSQAAEVARPSGQTLAAFSTGQWTKYKVDLGDGQKTELTYKIVGEEEGAHWLEIVRGPAGAGTVIQLLVKVPNRNDPNSLEIKAARIRMPNGHVRDIRGKMLEPTSEGYKRSLADIFLPALAGAPQEDVTVPAGVFRGCFKTLQKAETKDGSSSYNAWVHPTVPISGVVRSEEVGSKSKTELVAYGSTGAESEIKEPPKP